MKRIKLFITIIMVFSYSTTIAQTKEETKKWLENTGSNLIQDHYTHSDGSTKDYYSYDFKFISDDRIKIHAYHEWKLKGKRSGDKDYYAKIPLKNIKSCYILRETSYYRLVIDTEIVFKVTVATFDNEFDQDRSFFNINGEKESLKRIQKAIIHLARLYGATVEDPVDENTF